MARKKPTPESKMDSVVELARKRFERCREAYSANRVLSIEDTKFALGDSDNGWQWPEDIRENRTGDKRPCLTVNMTAQHCNQVINNIRQNRPQARVLPVDNRSDKKSAEIMAGLLRNIQTSSNADDAHDLAAEHSVYGGEGYWRVLTEYESETSFNQIIKIKSIANPLLVYVDDMAVELDKSDAKFGFIFQDILKEQCARDYPDIECLTWAMDNDGWVQKDTVRIAEYFYQEHVSDTVFLLPTGETFLKSERPDVEPLAINKRATQRVQWKWCKLIGGHEEPVDAKDWAGKFLPIISCVGKEVNVNGEIIRKGMVRDLKDPARMVNYSYSAAIETVALQNKVPYMAAAEAVEGYEDIWGRSNLENRAYLPFNAFDENGNAIPIPQRQQPAVMPAAQVQMLQLSTEQMRAASGQQNANFGIKSEASSGVGIQRLKAQGEIATFHFPDNLVRALRYEAKVLIDLIPKIYDTKRVVRILGLDGSDEQAMLDPDMPQPSMEMKGEAEVKQAFNPTLGLYDVVIDTGPSFQTQRQEAAAALTELSGRNPGLMQVAGDLIVRSLDIPMAEELANRLEKTIPPELREDEDNAPQIPPQVKQAMDQMSMQLEQMGQALQEAQAAANDKSADSQAKMGDLELKARELELKEREIGIKEFDAETKRMQVMQAQVEPEQPAEPQADPIAGLAEGMNASNAQLAEAIAQVAAMSQSAQQQMAETLSGVMQTLSKPRRVNVLRDPQTGRAIGAEQVVED